MAKAVNQTYLVSRGQSRNFLAIVDEVEFTNGTIEVELAGQATPGVQQGARGFVGITWSLQDNRKTYDCFYLRPTNESANYQERRNHSVQYISHPEWTWYRDAPLAGHPIMELGSGLIEGRMIVERGFYSCRFYAIINATRVSDDCEQMAIGGGRPCQSYP